MNAKKIKQMAHALEVQTNALRETVAPLAAGVLPERCFDEKNPWYSWSFHVNEGKLTVLGIESDDRGPTRIFERHNIDLDTMEAVEKERYTHCDRCGGKWVKQTRGIPMKRTCENGHTWIVGEGRGR